MASRVDESPATARLEQPRILVVGHKKTNLSVLTRRLSDGGYRVTSAADSASAIAELHRSPFDLVIADLHLPRTSGAELTRLIRDDSAWSDTPVMLITGRSDPQEAVRAYEAGADDVILKPFHFEVLFARIERRLEAVRALKALRCDNAVLDARIITRAIQIRELRDQVRELEAERHRLRMFAPAARA